jgi:hypothetical protein
MQSASKMLRITTENISIELSLIILDLINTAPSTDNLAKAIYQLHKWETEIDTLSGLIKSNLIALYSPLETEPAE